MRKKTFIKKTRWQSPSILKNKDSDSNPSLLSQGLESMTRTQSLCPSFKSGVLFSGPRRLNCLNMKSTFTIILPITNPSLVILNALLILLIIIKTYVLQYVLFFVIFILQNRSVITSLGERLWTSVFKTFPGPIIFVRNLSYVFVNFNICSRIIFYHKNIY